MSMKNTKIPFNVPLVCEETNSYVLDAISRKKLSGGNYYNKSCESWFENYYECHRALLTPSGTHALEMCALLLNIKPGDEVIIPSYTFVSTANAFALFGAKIIFVDIELNTLNIDIDSLRSAITPRTVAVCAVNYGGYSCDLDRLVSVCSDSNIVLIEDAAQSLGAELNGKKLGTFGDLSAVSFHETKNFTSGGEGGLLIINNREFVEKAEIIREKGTNRSKFFKGLVDKYSWVSLGSSYLLNEISAAYLYSTLVNFQLVNTKRQLLHAVYDSAFNSLEDVKVIKALPSSVGNGHLFYLLLPSEQKRDLFIELMMGSGIMCVFHYLPLHLAPPALRYAQGDVDLPNTVAVAERLVRLPIYYELSKSKQKEVISAAHSILQKIL